VPISIFSTISGVVSVGMPSLVPPEYVDLAQKVVGGVNVLTGILTYFQTYLKFAQKAESHHHAAVGWSKLDRNMRIELKIDRVHRKEADTFIRVCRSEYDRLIEQSPVIPKDIIKKFKSKFSSKSHHAALIKPDICDNLTHAEITKPEEEPESPEPEPVFPTIPTESQDEVLRKIKDMLAESRLVPIGVRDSELTSNPGFTAKNVPIFSSQTINSQFDKYKPIAPRKSFLGTPPPPKEIEGATSVRRSVKDLAKQYEARGSIPMLNLNFKKDKEENKTSFREPSASLSVNLENAVRQINSEMELEHEEQPSTPRVEIEPIVQPQHSIVAQSVDLNEVVVNVHSTPPPSSDPSPRNNENAS